MSGQLSHQYVIAELVGYYRKYADNPQYQRATLEVWETAGKSGGQYSGAYAVAVRQIRAGNN